MNDVVASALINEIFRANVRAVIEERGLSIRGIARDLGIDYSAFHNFLSGKKGVSLDRAALIAEHLQIPLAELIEKREVAAR